MFVGTDLAENLYRDRVMFSVVRRVCDAGNIKIYIGNDPGINGGPRGSAAANSVAAEESGAVCADERDTLA